MDPSDAAGPAKSAPAEILATTPAGGQINCDWESLNVAIDALVALLIKTGAHDTHVVFRCGTVAQVDDDSAEFKGYDGSTYAFPDCNKMFARTVRLIMEDNCRVYDAQRSLGNAVVSRAIRQGYSALIRQNYPFPGPDARRWGQKTDIAAPLLLVHWPGLDTRSRVFNIALGKDAELAVSATGDLRRSDYMFPEVAAVIVPKGGSKLEVWRYSGARFETHPC